jgi:mRNA-degrading endonuclease RelE of RelBE toxin-antitoxin system
MKTKVRVSEQVEGFVKSLAPHPRHRLRLAIKGLAAGAGDIKSLEGLLAGYGRLSVAGCRVIYRERAERGVRIIDCIYAERRALVYEIFVRLLAEQTMEEPRGTPLRGRQGRRFPPAT